MPKDASLDFGSGDAVQYWYLAASAPPPGATTQWLAFRLRLHDFVAHTPGSHFAIALRARLGYAAGGAPAWISGRGMTFGDTSQAQPPPLDAHAQAGGFGGARGAQIESFWQGGNFLYADTARLAGGLEDGRWYAIELHVSQTRWIAFAVTPEGGATERASIQDRATHPVVPDATGVLIGIGRGAQETGSWRVELRDLATGWF
jgi:hypothetical protein